MWHVLHLWAIFDLKQSGSEGEPLNLKQPPHLLVQGGCCSSSVGCPEGTSLNRRRQGQGITRFDCFRGSSAGLTLCMLGLDEFERRQESHLSLTAPLSLRLHCSPEHHVVWFVPERSICWPDMFDCWRTEAWWEFIQLVMITIQVMRQVWTLHPPQSMEKQVYIG